MRLNTLFLIASYLLFGCEGNGLYPLKIDPKSQTLKNKTWQLYSTDIVDTSNGQAKYVARKMPDGCMEQLVFKNSDSLQQFDSCSGGPSIIRMGHWTWYETMPGLTAEIFTDSQGQSVNLFYNYTYDTLQFQTNPPLALDSAYTKFDLRIRTYIIK